MFSAYLHSPGEYLLPALLLLAAVCFGLPATIGLVYYCWRNRRRKSTGREDTPLHIEK